MKGPAFALPALLFLIPGCAHNAKWMQHQPGVESTIGTDFNKAPAGKVIPSPGIGVDLSDRAGDSIIDGSRSALRIA